MHGAQNAELFDIPDLIAVSFCMWVSIVLSSIIVNGFNVVIPWYGFVFKDVLGVFCTFPFLIGIYLNPTY